jgi:hypothetical protein
MFTVAALAQQSLTESDIKRFITTNNEFGFTEEEQQFVKTHAFAQNQNEPVYKKALTVMKSNGYADFSAYQNQSREIIAAFRQNKSSESNQTNIQGTIESIKKQLNDPALSAETKAALKKELNKLENGPGPNAEVAKPFMAELEKALPNMIR